MSSTGKGMQTQEGSAEETKATPRGAGQGLGRPLGAEQGEWPPSLTKGPQAQTLAWPTERVQGQLLRGSAELRAPSKPWGSIGGLPQHSTSHVGVASPLTRWRGASSWRNHKPGPGRRSARGRVHPEGCLLAREKPGGTCDSGRQAARCSSRTRADAEEPSLGHPEGRWTRRVCKAPEPGSLCY